MKDLLIIAISGLCLLTITAIPLPSGVSEQTSGIDIVQIPLQNNKELDILSLPETEGQLSERSKRTIGVLRELFPELSKQVEQSIQQKIQLLLPVILRTVGPVLLRSGIGGFGGGGSAGGSTATSDDEDDNNDDDDDSSSSDGNASTRQGEGGRKVSISLPTFPPDTDDDEDEDEDNVSDSVSSNNVETAQASTKIATVVTTPSTSPSLIRSSTLASASVIDENDVSDVFDADKSVKFDTSSDSDDGDEDEQSAPVNSKTDSNANSAAVSAVSDTVASADFNDSTGSAAGGPSTPSALYLPPYYNENAVRRRKAIYK